MKKRDSNGRFKNVGKNPVDLYENYAIIWTTDKKGNKKDSFKVDLEDLDKVLKFRWSTSTDGYAKSKSFKMHRIILNAQNGEIVDHINQDKTDNRKNNLRIVSHGLNLRNSDKTNSLTGHKHIIKMGNWYTVQLKCRGERYYIGMIKTIEEAIEKRNELYNKIKYFEE